MMETLRTLIWVAGIGQLILVVGSLAIPRVLNWSEQLADLRPLIRQIFWTYAGYIWYTNLSFGIISTVAPESLIDGSFLAGAVTFYITLYWFVRIVVQFVYFDRSDAPQGKWVWFAEAALISLFVGLTGVYGVACFQNFVEA